MKANEKDLLLRDLCARLPYNTKVFFSIIEEDEPVELSLSVIRCLESIPLGQNDIVIKPYLHSMSSMTEEEFGYFMGLRGRMLQSYEIQSMMKEAFNMPQFVRIATTLGSYSNKIDWLNKNHFDYRGLIEKDLAIAVTEENNPYNRLNSMPVIYPKRIREKLHSLNLEKVKESLMKNGYKFIRDGGFRKDDKPFKFCNYLFYMHPETKTAIRVGYNYPLFGNRSIIFEICYAKNYQQWWTDVTPNFSQTCWKEVSDWYKLMNGKYVRK